MTSSPEANEKRGDIRKHPRALLRYAGRTQKARTRNGDGLFWAVTLFRMEKRGFSHSILVWVRLYLIGTRISAIM